jgi:hypothetical protein
MTITNTNMLYERTEQRLNERWIQTCLGTGEIALSEKMLRMSIAATKQGQYADAQIDDYGKRARRDFPWRPPLRMDIRARASHEAARENKQDYLRGTAGFGFWNYPFSVRGDILMLPEAIWFFYAAPPSNMALVPSMPGWGWKAQVIHAMRAESALAVLPTALATGWNHLTGDARPAARWMQKLSGASETLLPVDLAGWHTYSLEWRADQAIFFVDGQRMLQVQNPPTRALGFVAWIDNQYAIATPRGQLRFGTVDCDTQWLDIESIRIAGM